MQFSLPEHRFQKWPDRGARAATSIAWVVCAAIALAVMFLFDAKSADADVIVLANHSGKRVSATVRPLNSSAIQVVLPPGDVVPVFVDGQAYVEFGTPAAAKRYLLDANSAYYFGLTANRTLDLHKIGLGSTPATATGRKLPGRAATAPKATIGVKVFVDEEEPARNLIWQRRLRRRIEAASDVLSELFQIELNIIGFETWNSDNETTDFFDSLTEFERESQPFPGHLAIGFTSQFDVQIGRMHLAGTRGALHSHILVREASPRIGERERLELLLHELGHFLGAAHSPEDNSVMRPVLTPLAGQTDLRIRFDPVNTLAIAMVSEEMRRRRIEDMGELTLGSKQRLRQVYQELQRAFPEDPAASQFVRTVNTGANMPLLIGTQQVLHRIVQSAESNRSLPIAGQTSAVGPTRREGDALTSYYVRQAAAAARSLSKEVAAPAFLLALGIAMDDSDTLQRLPNTRQIVSAVESARDRAQRLVALGKPTMGGRTDWAKHFFVSSFLAVVSGSGAAQAAGLTKEMIDSHGKSGFSFADLAADRAGILFAGGVVKRRFSLEVLFGGFEVANYFPSMADLPEGLTSGELVADFGTVEDERFKDQIKEIDARVLALLPYRLVGQHSDPPH